ncbi:ABC-type transport auxiliary lipoprotein family protein [Massilia sp. TS11]|uniref:ABC-type transport auxiliary lipoprotein family protein n=1 Tax=Massilia sp. TS11 TaxID=2908003 RepID=UPI001EDA7CDF|nr:ABC-type transport auxiliary lipoprotein family protein [Massilia sp. TS11]MCG2586602.1 PqiC family protein [Massilia sp. TS11]
MTRLILLLAALALSACSTVGSAPHQQVYDFGPAPAASPVKLKLSTLVVAEASGAAPLDTPQILYRLLYADPLQTRAYANSHWSSSPLQLLSQRVRTRLADSGIGVLGTADARSGAPVLKLEVLDFSHSFAGPASSSGRVSVRASVFNGSRLQAQQTFTQTSPAGTHDAAGGVAALVRATDALSAELLQWLAQLP